ncbi:hypothetical protein HAPAU_35720 [Halalkalicoccus paucihalophilus]|uniref:Uncharacterized protein n=1 Tax=Halalkalicoccus paucihalophilus TaxID=1008153 RepID=A0A151AAE1_9EURY|nr:DUF5797 family protein [Halalkalicoccus paucihalophilus]KYH24589.1 hypothetical protein HAPAU_35720 [Halalkalicoccus paucihalophilus]
MTQKGLPTSRVSIDRIFNNGESVHKRENGEDLHLGLLPPEAAGKELLVEMWDQNEGRVVDPRYRPERDPPHDTISTSKTQARLSMDSPNLGKGDYVVGIVRNGQFKGDPKLVTGGYQIKIPEARSGEIAIAQVNEAERQKFGANHAKATRIDYPSAFVASDKADLGLKRLMSDGRWRKVPLGRLERTVLPEMVRLIRERESVSILNPGFDPDFPLRAVIELLYNAEPRSNVALLTSGTSVHWGQKGEVRDTYRGYGLAVNEGETRTAVPLDQVFAHSYVSNGELKTSSESLLNRRLVLTKKIDELSAVSDLSVITVDYTSRKTGVNKETITKLRERFPNTPIVSIASLYTKNEGDGVPRYAPPSFLEEDKVIPNSSDIKEACNGYTPQVGRTTIGTNGEHYASGSEGSPFPPSITDTLGLLREPRIEVQPVEGDDLSRWFKMVTKHFTDLLDNNVEQAAYKIYSREMFFKRLPVSTYLYNEWIRQQYAEGERYLPETTDGILEDLETYGGQIEDLRAPASIFGALRALRKVEISLRDRNPMFERIRDEVLDAVENGFRLGIFCPRKSWVHMLREALSQDSVPEDVIGTSVVLLNSDSIRDMPPCRHLLFPGPQHPHYAGFYLHPRTKKTVILSYNDQRTGTIEKHAKQYINQLNIMTSGAAESPYPMPALNAQGPVGELTSSESIKGDLLKKDESEVPKDNQTVDLTKKDLQRLAQLVEFAPTKNSELAEAWDYNSGSEVYQYLIANLKEFYTRNEDKLIVPTKEGERAVKQLKNED